MKIIFLDIDGVMNFICIPKEDKVKHGIGEMSKIAIDLLNQYTSANDIKLVISSTWRNDTRQGNIQEYMSLFGITGEVIGITPVIDIALRGNEIRKWLQINKEIIGCHEYEYKDYVILDDDSDMLLWQKDNFIQTDRWTGITPTTFWKMDNIFKIKTEMNYDRFAYRKIKEI